jgi:hypothetical protein
MNAKSDVDSLLEEPHLRRAYVRALSETLGSSNLKTTMQYLLMIYEGEKWPALPAQERRRVANECETWHQDLVVRGIAVVGSRAASAFGRLCCKGKARTASRE